MGIEQGPGITVMMDPPADTTVTKIRLVCITCQEAELPSILAENMAANNMCVLSAVLPWGIPHVGHYLSLQQYTYVIPADGWEDATPETAKGIGPH